MCSSDLVRRMSQRHTVLNMPSASQRVCAILVDMAGTAPAADGRVVMDAPRQKELASMANTSRETVSRTLGQLMEAGVLEKNSGRLTVMRLAELRVQAGLD